MSSLIPTAAADDVLLAHGATGLLAEFNAGGVLDASDVRTAMAIGRIGGERDERVLLALALTVRALRSGSVCVDLATASATAFDDSETGIDLVALPWPEPESWQGAVLASPLTHDGPDGTGDRPLRRAGGLLYLERYWHQEEQVRTELQRRLSAEPPSIDAARLRETLDRLFEPTREAADQRLAAAVSALGRVTVLAGGPGTGKTTTVARVLAILTDQPGDRPRVALAAPTGKAAARLGEAVRSAADLLPEADRDRIGEVSASTLHRLLGWVPGSRSRFRHDANNQLPHDVVIVDEMSMVSLTMMARLLDAVRPSARLILVGDPDQLSSVEAGAVLADIARAPGQPDAELDAALDGLGLQGGADQQRPVHRVVQLRHTWRFGGAIATLADAIRTDAADAALAVLRSGAPDVGFTELADDAGDDPFRPDQLTDLANRVRRAGRTTLDAARAGDHVAALAALEQHRLLCAHRRGPYGQSRWVLEVERWLAEAIPGYGEEGEWYPGRPLLVTANDYELNLYNGDTGVVVRTPDGDLRAFFGRGSEPVAYAPVRLDAVQTVHAMTVHRAQGSQFEAVSFIVPPVTSPLLTRELLYTAVTRATDHVQVIASEAAIRRAIARPANRASGLRHRLAPSGLPGVGTAARTADGLGRGPGSGVGGGVTRSVDP